MLSCRELIDFLYAYLEDELDPVERERFSQHLELCSDCRDYLDSYQRLIRMAPQAFAEDLPAELPDELARAVLNARRDPAR